MRLPEPDIPYDEAMKKKQEEQGEAIRKMNNALQLTGNVARVVGQYYMGLIAEGVSEEAAIELTKEWSKPLQERFM
jgi:hypothetical protein